MKIIEETNTLISKRNFEIFRKQLIRQSYSKHGSYYAFKTEYDENNNSYAYVLIRLKYNEISTCSVIANGLFPILK